MMTKKRDVSEELQKEAEILHELNLRPDEIEFVLYNRLKARRMSEY